MDSGAIEAAHDEVVAAANQLAHSAKKLAKEPESEARRAARAAAGASYRAATERFSRLCGADGAESP